VPFPLTTCQYHETRKGGGKGEKKNVVGGKEEEIPRSSFSTISLKCHRHVRGEGEEGGKRRKSSSNRWFSFFVARGGQKGFLPEPSFFPSSLSFSSPLYGDFIHTKSEKAAGRQGSEGGEKERPLVPLVACAIRATRCSSPYRPLRMDPEQEEGEKKKGKKATLPSHSASLRPVSGSNFRSQ